MTVPALSADRVSDLPRVVTHDNLKAAGELKNGMLTLKLEVKPGAWYPEAEDGQGIPVLTLAEEGGAPMIPGPLVRVDEGTRIHVSVRNSTVVPVVMHGLHARPGDARDTFTVNPGEKKEVEFLAGAPGTYFYWGTTFADVPIFARPTTDTELSGAFIVDAPGQAKNDRIMVLGLWYHWLVPFDFNEDHGFYEVLSINGKSYPHTTRLTYTAGDTARWRVINATVAMHPMHMHGAFYRVDSEGDGEKDTIYAPDMQRTVVTESMKPGRTMLLTWTPERAGNWLFHCHLMLHMDAGHLAGAMGRMMGQETGMASHGSHAEMEKGGASGMAGLVVPITVLPNPKAVAAKVTPDPARRLTLTLSNSAAINGRTSVRVDISDGKTTQSTAPGTEAGPPLVLHRNQPTEITVVNRLNEATAIHWHGIELESYYDGVPGITGDSRQVTPPIPPGTSFVVRMTPPHAGTFIYHTHWHDMKQLTTGLYGALIVLEPGETYDPEHDRSYVVGRAGADLFQSPLLVNGTRGGMATEFKAGSKYRLRFINITPDDDAVEFKLMDGDKPVRWRALAKDGATLPKNQATACDATQAFGAGETYDFEFEPEHAGELKLVTSFFGQRVEVPVRVR